MVVDETNDVVPRFSAGIVQQTGLRKDLENCDPAVIHRHRCMSRDAGIVFEFWSGARDLNPGPHGPEPCALPNCASPRRGLILSGAVFGHGLGWEARIEPG